ncbi:hypothetical protein GF358_03715 [Candidatus Woesearchaeota archaeon]|nr:hypothetical protein [Candidatus Woesearchaeota archaeon]
MKWVVVLLILILFCSFVSADFNGQYDTACGNSAIEMGEECDPPGKKCYTPDLLEGKCTAECMCREYTGPACGNTFIETGEDCESDSDCPALHYCNADCRCIAKIAAAENITKETPEKEIEEEKEVIEQRSFEEIQKQVEEEIEKKYTVEEYVVNESYFKAEHFNESIGIKITGAVTKVAESLFGKLFDLIRGWLL